MSNASRRSRSRKIALSIGAVVGLLAAPLLAIAWLVFNITVALDNGATLGFLGEPSSPPSGPWVAPLGWLSTGVVVALDLTFAYLAYRGALYLLRREG